MICDSLNTPLRGNCNLVSNASHVYLKFVVSLKEVTVVTKQNDEGSQRKTEILFHCADLFCVLWDLKGLHLNVYLS